MQVFLNSLFLTLIKLHSLREYVCEGDIERERERGRERERTIKGCTIVRYMGEEDYLLHILASPKGVAFATEMASSSSSNLKLMSKSRHMICNFGTSLGLLDYRSNGSKRLLMS